MRRPRATREMEWRLESALTRSRSLKRSGLGVEVTAGGEIKVEGICQTHDLAASHRVG